MISKTYTVLATAKCTLLSFLLKNEDAYFRERKRIFQRTKTQKEIENAKITKTHKNEDAKERISIGSLFKSLQIVNSFLYIKTIFRLPLEINIQHIILIFNEK